MKKEYIYTLLNYISLVACIILGTSFLIQLISIYQSGSANPFSYEIVQDKIKQIIVLIIVCVLLIVAISIFLSIKLSAKKEKISVSNEDRYKMLNKKFDFHQLPLEVSKKLVSLNKKRLISLFVTLIITAICMVFCLIYLINLFKNTSRDINNVVIALCIHFAPFIFISYISLVIYYFVKEKIYDASYLIVKDNLKGLGKNVYHENKNKIIINSIRIAIVLISLLLIFVGFNEGYQDVLMKAENICTECIGLG